MTQRVHWQRRMPQSDTGLREHGHLISVRDGSFPKLCVSVYGVKINLALLVVRVLNYFNIFQDN